MTLKQTLRLFGLAAAIATATTIARADIVLFQENFERGNLEQWTGKAGEAHNGIIVKDPLRPRNKVLSFSEVNTAGDIFTVEKLAVNGPRRYVLSFDFLGRSTTPTSPVEFGGFVGIITEPAWYVEHYWVAGTYLPALNVPTPTATELIADGRWRRYEIDITDVIETSGMTELHLMLEDWLELQSIPGDVFFDNIKLVGVLDTTGFEELVPCSGPLSGGLWRNRGEYVAAMTEVVQASVKAGLITRQEAAAIILTAVRSDCGKSSYNPNRGDCFRKAVRLWQSLQQHHATSAWGHR